MDFSNTLDVILTRVRILEARIIELESPAATPVRVTVEYSELEAALAMLGIAVARRGLP